MVIRNFSELNRNFFLKEVIRKEILSVPQTQCQVSAHAEASIWFENWRVVGPKSSARGTGLRNFFE